MVNSIPRSREIDDCVDDAPADAFALGLLIDA